MRRRLMIPLLMLSLMMTACQKGYVAEEENEDEPEYDIDTDLEEKEKNNGTDNDSTVARESTVDVATFRRSSITYQVYVKGYIVGTATGRYNRPKFEFEAPFTYDTAILLADTKSASSTDEVITVCLTKGYGNPRAVLNLKDNPDNKGREVTIYGYKDTYLGLPGIREIDGWDFNTAK